MSKLKDLTNLKFGRLFVIKRVENYVQENGRTRTRWLCKCDCGKEYIAYGQHLIHGNIVSCGCLKNEKAAARMRERKGKPAKNKRTKDLIGMRFGKLTVVEKANSIKNKVAWLCKCDCGNYTTVRANHLLRGLIKSCGCVASYGEKRISAILNKEGVRYQTQYTMPELISSTGGRLRFDFAFLDQNNNLLALLEYEGEQHLLTCEKDFGKQQREETDDLKINYCYDHDIPLYFIWFYEDLEESLYMILNEIFRMSIPCQASQEEGVTTISEESKHE